MNIKRLIIASLSVFAAFQVFDILEHSLILGPLYMEMTNIWRPNMMELMWVMFLTSCVFSFAFVYIFTRGYENKGIMEGVRYGFYIGILMNVVGIFNQYVVYPIPLFLAVYWFLFEMVRYVIYGMITAAVYKPAES